MKDKNSMFTIYALYKRIKMKIFDKVYHKVAI